VRLDRDFFTGVFAPLEDAQRFAEVTIDRGAVAWPGGIELAPDVLYEQVRLEQSASDVLV
jgi:hypothetical protein